MNLFLPSSFNFDSFKQSSLHTLKLYLYSSDATYGTAILDVLVIKKEFLILSFSNTCDLKNPVAISHPSSDL